MGMILHDWNLEKKMHLVQAAYDALPPGGAFIVVENLIDDARRENAFGLMMSLNSQRSRSLFGEAIVNKLQVQGVHHITLVGSTKKSAVDFWQGTLGMPFIFEQPNLGKPMRITCTSIQEMVACSPSLLTSRARKPDDPRPERLAAWSTSR